LLALRSLPGGLRREATRVDRIVGWVTSEVRNVDKRIDRRTFVKTAAAGSLAAALPLIGTSFALARESDNDDGGHRIFVFVSFSQAPTRTSSPTQPRIGMTGAGTFKPSARYVNGGGSYVLSDQAVSVPRPLVVSGRWMARQFVSYTTKGLASYGTIQPGILVMMADVEGIGEGLTLAVVCNVGAQGPAGATGDEEGWELFDTSAYGTFHQTGVGISHMSVEGFTIAGLGRSAED
jgi:hypothetical protein